MIVARIVAFLIMAGIAVSAAGCAVVEIREAYGVNQLKPAQVAGFTDVRLWADTDTPQLHAAMRKRLVQERAAGAKNTSGYSALALSGGADDGAFGAGYLVGWTERGDRPAFTLVTGVSTGALIAPLAFLGPSRDRQLMSAFTEASASGIFHSKGLIEGLIGDSLASTAPLQLLVAQYVDEQMVADIAAEHIKGRRLRVLTTNLDAQRPIAWDLGEIATRGGPAALKLIRDCIVASASVPGVFPPVMIEAQIDGKVIREMHVDGGTTRNVFLIPSNANLQDIRGLTGHGLRPQVYVVFNGRLDPEFALVERRTLAIASRAISTLIKSHAQSTVSELRTFAEREKGSFKIASIGPDFKAVSPAPFDQAYMNALFEYGRAAGASGTAWR